MRKLWGKDAIRAALPATNSGPKPGDFPLGSVESRVAARAVLERRADEPVRVVIGLLAGIPRFLSGTPVVSPPDTVAHYEAPDGSIVEVIRREYAPGKFTVFIDQMWKDGNAYNGSHRLKDYAELERLRSIPLQPTVWEGERKYGNT